MDEETEPRRGRIRGHHAGEWPRRDSNPGGLASASTSPGPLTCPLPGAAWFTALPRGVNGRAVSRNTRSQAR